MRVAWEAGPRQLVVILVAQLIAAIGLVVELLVARAVLDRIVNNGRVSLTSGLILLLAVLVGTVFLISLADIVQRQLGGLLGERVGRSAANRVLDVASTVDLDAFEQPAFYDRLQRAQFTAASRHLMVMRGLVSLLGALFATVGVAIGLAAVQPLLAVVAVVSVVPLWLVTKRNSQAMYQFSFDMVPLDRERVYLWSSLSERGMAKEVRAYGLEPFLRAEHDVRYDERIDRLRDVVKRRLRQTVLASMLGMVVTACALVGLLGLVDRGTVRLSEAGVAFIGLLLLTQRLAGVASGAGALYESALFLEDYVSFVDLLPPPTVATGHAAPSPVECFALRDVSFTYPESDRPAVHHVSLEVRKGEVVALVGRNGSGKTTLAKLLAGLHRPTSGSVTWNGVDLDHIDRSQARDDITVVFQDFVRWNLPVATNIGFGRSECLSDRDRIVSAAEQAGADTFISRFDEGYDALLGRLFRGGADLSIGQWQRIAIARALFRDAPFVIMDEPSAALDPVAEFQLYELIRERLGGQTIVLISHRFSSARLADRVYVLDDGELIEQGSHDELMDQNGSYAEMFRLQASPYLD